MRRVVEIMGRSFTATKGTWKKGAFKGDFTPEAYPGSVLANSSEASGDEATSPGIPLEAGTYTVEVLYGKSPISGVFKVLFGGTEIASINAAGTAEANKREIITGVIIKATGEYHVGIECGAAGTQVILQWVKIIRTA
jgi:hypothetical protein